MRSGPELRSILTDKNGKLQNNKSDGDGNIDGKNPVYTKPNRTHSSPHPTVLNNVDGPIISSNEVVNIALCENEIPVSFYSEPDWKF